MTLAAQFGRTRSDSDTGRGVTLERLGPAQDTWGGHALVLLLLSALGYQVVGRLIDGAHLVTDSTGRMSVVVDGRMNTLVGVGLFCAAVAAAGAACLAPSPRGRFGSSFGLFVQLLVLWWVTLSVLIPRKDLTVPDLVIIGAIPLVVGVASAPPTLTTVRRLNLIRDLFAVGQLVYPFLAPDVARLPCRPDKCGIFGYLDAGFFTQENSGIEAISLLLPLAAASSPRRLAFSSSVAAMVALASGSRTGLVSVAVATVVAVYVRHLYSGGAPRATLSLLLLGAPLAATALSLGLFLFADTGALTGRGAVYAANLKALHGPALLYGVPWNTVEVASDGYLTGDHGQASHILAKTGVVGFGLWVCALLMPLRRRSVGPLEGIGLGVLAAAAARMLTESTFELEARTTGFLALLVVVGLCANRASEGDEDGESMPSRREVRLGAAAGVAIAAAVGVLPALLPPVYSASTIIASVVPVSDSTSGEESYYARTDGAATIEGLGGSHAVLPAALTRAGVPADTDVSVSIDRAPGERYLRLATTGADAATTARVNDAVARLMQDELSIAPSSPRGAAYAVRPLGGSVVERINPWRAHLPLTLAIAGAGALAIAVIGRLGRAGLRHGRHRHG